MLRRNSLIACCLTATGALLLPVLLLGLLAALLVLLVSAEFGAWVVARCIHYCWCCCETAYWRYPGVATGSLASRRRRLGYDPRGRVVTHTLHS